MKRCTVGLGLIGLVLTQIPARADSQGTYLQCLTNFETYAESIWHTASYSNAPADAGYWGMAQAVATAVSAATVAWRLPTRCWQRRIQAIPN